MKLTINFLLLLLFGAAAFPQNNDGKRDYQWLISPVLFTSLNKPLLDFSLYPPNVSVFNTKITTYGTNSSICDTAGHLLIFSNGQTVFDRNGDTMPNGDSLNFGNGYYGISSTIILPLPESNSIYLLLHVGYPDPQTFSYWNGANLYVSTISMNLNNGNGDVTSKNLIVHQGSMSFSGFCTVRHSNNRDWWLLVPDISTNAFYRYLINSDGVLFDGIQNIGNTRQYEPIMTFSPDGEKYAIFDYKWSTIDPSICDHYGMTGNFDRSNGLILDSTLLNWPDSSSWVFSVDFSPNSRFLYLPLGNHLYQWDTESSDIGGSKTTVATANGFHWGAVKLGFNQGHLAPDGKIYISSGGPYLQVVNYPDQPGLACDVIQESLALPLNYGFVAMPIFPNFRLGCFTGINSTYTLPTASLHAQPNPAHEQLRFEVEVSDNSNPLRFEIVNMLGESVHAEYFAPFQSILNYDVSDLSPGVYVALLRDKSALLGKVKFAVD